MKRIAAALAPLALLVACGTAPGTPTPPSSSSDATVSASPTDSESPFPVPSDSGPQSPVPSASGSTSPSEPATGTPSAGTSEPPPPTGTGQVEVKRTPARPPFVKGARSAAHPGYDRVVIDLQGPKTGYTVGWVKQIVEDGSGDPVELKGGAFLQVTMTPAAAHTEDGKPTWGRRPVLLPGLTNVRGVVRSGDFEGVVTVAISLRHRAGFRVIEQSDPYRLVIDVAH
ncbi:AMIN-like domain-containing (lipo)protein [Sphaerisporangium corydalis]|uniref:AMIN-like domain-containing protein n=1 Tax=Sphaerisporangium corydalis TaxID=1441875 RepID=A0ABV9EDQ7_9ACTN|nr:hypothetical protein [Sphaerisporangium corydalis]